MFEILTVIVVFLLSAILKEDPSELAETNRNVSRPRWNASSTTALSLRSTLHMLR